MELNKNSSNITDDELSIGTIEELYAKRLVMGKYTFRIRPNLHGKELFMLVNTFGVTLDSQNKVKSMQSIFNNFGANYDLAFDYFEYSKNSIDFMPLVINGVCQVEEVEKNVIMMYQLFIHLQTFAVLFTEISQRQLEDTKPSGNI